MQQIPFTQIVNELIKPIYLIVTTAAALLFYSQSYQLFKENRDLKKKLGRED